MRTKLLALIILGLAPPAHAWQVTCLDGFASRYIGETERNLSRTFAVAAQSDVVLTFDEADALFGRDEEPSGAHDRYANQEVAYLLARIENTHTIVRVTINGRRVVAAGFDRPSRNAGIVLIETAGGARVIDFTRADRRRAIAYAEASLEACPAPAH